MAVATAAFAVLLIYWRLLLVGDLNLPLTIFWFLFPDLVAFIPIAAFLRRSREWPPWGPALYNVAHTFAVWLPVIALWSVLQGRIEWPLLAWAGHITLDRAVGYTLRAAQAKPNS
jgi:hypothetical protein